MSEPTTTLPLSTGRERRGAQPAGPHLYLVMEADRPQAGGARHSLAGVDAVTLGRGEARAATRVAESSAYRLSLSVPDRRMSSRHARLGRALDRWVVEDTGSRNGVFVNGARTERAVLEDGDLVECGHTFFLYRHRVAIDLHDAADLDAGALRPAAPGLTTLVPGLARELARLAAVARSEVSVLVRGESGVGKELAARAVHALSGRDGEFVAVNCGAIPSSLVESELFGAKKGAFSGAIEDRMGLVRSADRGTLFLDEVGDLPLSAQAALLRALQEREVLSLGATRPAKVDVRVVTATHRDLDALVKEQKFRADLYARINAFQVALPPLRERGEDMGLLIAAMLERLAPGRAVRFAAEAARALLQYAWPLNVRELENALKTALVLAGEGVVELEHLPPAVRAAPVEQEAPPQGPLAPEDVQRKQEMEALLREHEGNVSAVARAMGKARMQVQRWLKRYGLEPERFRH